MIKRKIFFLGICIAYESRSGVPGLLLLSGRLLGSIIGSLRASGTLVVIETRVYKERVSKWNLCISFFLSLHGFLYLLRVGTHCSRLLFVDGSNCDRVESCINKGRIIS